MIDPAPAVVAHLARVLSERTLTTSADAKGSHHFYTTGSAVRFDAACQRLLGIAAACEEVHWNREITGQRVVLGPTGATAQQRTPRCF